MTKIHLAATAGVTGWLQHTGNPGMQTQACLAIQHRPSQITVRHGQKTSCARFSQGHTEESDH